jgi:hypothetical protein
LGVEGFEVMTELLSKRQGVIRCGRSRFRHGGQKYDTRRSVVATTCHPSLFTRRLFL